MLHPALPGSPGHASWRHLCAASAGLFSVVFHERYEPQQVHAFVDALRMFKIGYSWAGPVSLVVPYDLGAVRGEGDGLQVSPREAAKAQEGGAGGD